MTIRVEGKMQDRLQKRTKVKSIGQECPTPHEPIRSKQKQVHPLRSLSLRSSQEDRISLEF